MLLSLSMLVKNEQQNITECLASVKGFVDEMVVIDTGSTDSTVELAKAAGAKVKNIPWEGDFAPARNHALKFVKGDWVLVLDADERLRKECIDELKVLMSNENSLLINLLRLEEGSLMFPYSRVSRLFRNLPTVKWTRPYHSTVDESISGIIEKESKWKIFNCGEPAIIHYGYHPDLIKHTSKAKRLRSAMELWLSENPGDPYPCSKLGALEVSEGNKSRGIFLLKKGLKNCDKFSAGKSMRYELLLHLGIALTTIDKNAALDSYRKALDISMDDRINIGALLNISALLMNMGKFKESYDYALSVTRSSPEVSIGWYNLGLIQRRMGDIRMAIISYHKAIKINPNYAEAHHNLGIAMLMSGDIKAARDGFRSAIFLYSFHGRKNEAEELRNKLKGFVKLGNVEA